MMLMAKETLEPIRAGALVIAGYVKKRPLSAMELGLMRVLHFFSYTTLVIIVIICFYQKGLHLRSPVSESGTGSVLARPGSV
jgi:hypothetical protein